MSALDGFDRDAQFRTMILEEGFKAALDRKMKNALCDAALRGRIGAELRRPLDNPAMAAAISDLGVLSVLPARMLIGEFSIPDHGYIRAWADAVSIVWEVCWNPFRAGTKPVLTFHECRVGGIDFGNAARNRSDAELLVEHFTERFEAMVAEMKKRGRDFEGGFLETTLQEIEAARARKAA